MRSKRRTPPTTANALDVPRGNRDEDLIALTIHGDAFAVRAVGDGAN